MSALYPLLILCARDKSQHTWDGSWAWIISVPEMRQLHTLPATLSTLLIQFWWHRCFSQEGDTLIPWCLGLLILEKFTEIWCTLRQGTLFKAFPSLNRQGNWGKHWSLIKSYPVTWRDRNKVSLLRIKIPPLRQASLGNTKHLAVSNYNTLDLLPWQSGFQELWAD